MKQILIATGNPSKYNLYFNILKNLSDRKIISLRDLNMKIDVDEPYESEEENARHKAQIYNKKTGHVVICDDTGLYFENVPSCIQPKSHVNRVCGESSSDEEIIKYYANLTQKYGEKKGKFYYLNGYYLKTIVVTNGLETKIFKYKVNKIFTNKVCDKRNVGYPLDSITITPDFNKYTVELTDEENFKLMEISNEQVLEFFKENLEYFK